MSTATYDFITVDEIARTLRVSPKTVRSWLSEGKLRAFKVSHKVWRIQRHDFEAFVQAGLRDGAPPADHPRPAEMPAPMPAPSPTKAAMLPRLQALRAQGLSHQAIAERLNTEQVPTFSGRGQWQAGTVGKLLQGAGDERRQA